LPKTAPGPGRRSGWRQQRREPDVTEEHNGRIGFGNRLRRLREDADLTGKDLAERLGWPASKVSRLENGRQTATVADVQAWTSATGVRPETRDQLIEDLRSLRVEYASWQRQLRSGFAPRQRVSRLLEDSTTTVRNLQTAVVPGLLQTPDYARALFRGLAAVYGPRDVEAAVRERIRRQEVLYEPDRDYRFLITESALRMRHCPPGVQRAQLDRLLVLAGLETVQIAVLLWTTELPTTPEHNFVMFDDRLVLVETINAELSIRDAEDIALYARLFEMYWDVAAKDEQASAEITRIALDLPK
jgi:transcriptional regulator with XRE-family HTH domain